MFIAGILRCVMRILSALGEANQRKAERELARHAHRIRWTGPSR